MPSPKVAVVVLNMNGAEFLKESLGSLLNQTLRAKVIFVDNASTDHSVGLVEDSFADVKIIRNDRNLGFSGGVNTGIRYAIEQGYDYVALFNNDAKADKNWLKLLAERLEGNSNLGIATGKFLNFTGEFIDSTGDTYSVWGLPYPRGRNERIIDKYDSDIAVFGATGGASLYRIKMLKEIGLFDEDFFAYYEDVDISFRAQLAGWKVVYVPKALAYHRISATNSRIKGFTTYHTLKNLPLLIWKDVPLSLMLKILPRFILAYLAICGRTLLRGQFGPLVKGTCMSLALLPKKLAERRKIQKSKRVSMDYIDSIIVHDLPPNAKNLRALRGTWWRLTGRNYENSD